MSGFQLFAMPDANPKVAKGMQRGVMTFALHLAPGNLSGFEVCPNRTNGCTNACLGAHAGRTAIDRPVRDRILAARVRKTLSYFNDRASFMETLACDVERAIAYAMKRDYDIACRPNATSDIPWHRVPVRGHASIMEAFPFVPFYDYTKVAKRLLRETLPPNYHLTFSLAENNEQDAIAVLNAGHNVAAVFRTREMVKRAIAEGYLGFPVIDGDETDLRFLDPRGGYLVALYAKGKAKTDQSGFVKDL